MELFKSGGYVFNLENMTFAQLRRNKSTNEEYIIIHYIGSENLIIHHNQDCFNEIKEKFWGKNNGDN